MDMKENIKSGLVKLLNKKLDAVVYECTLNNEKIVFYTVNGDIYKIQYKDNKQAKIFLKGTLTDFIDANIQKIKALDDGYKFITDRGEIVIAWVLDNLLDTVEDILEFETVYLKAQDECIKPKK